MEKDDITNNYIFLYEGLHFDFVYISSLSAWISKYEITLNEYRQYDPSYKHDFSDYINYSDRWPAFNISATEAMEFSNWLNKGAKTILPKGYVFRLPSVEEWRTIAKCGEDRIYPWGNSWPPCQMEDGHGANYLGEETLAEKAQKRLVPLEITEAKKIPDTYTQCIKDYNDTFINLAPVEHSGMNKFGVYGIGGNVEEWAYSERRSDYVLMGGSFYMSKPDFLNLSFERFIAPKPHPMLPLMKDKQSDYGAGFRLILGKDKN